MIQTKVYDCSNSDERPRTREYGGAVENAVVTMLKKYGSEYGVVFVDAPEKCDVLFTNDVFPEQLLVLKQPKVKRMDGIYWQEDLKDRNLPYNRAAEQADHVIFISQFSRNSLYELYKIKPRQSSVITNWVDSKIFYPKKDVKDVRRPRKFVAIATSWKREEKRLRSTLAFAEHILKDGELFLIGNPGEPVMNIPANVTMLGYIDNPRTLADVLRGMDAAINFSYRDACPKVVMEAASCGLPVLYADSGGAAEAAYGYGVAIRDFYEMVFESQTPDLELDNMNQYYDMFTSYYSKFRDYCLNIQLFQALSQSLVEKYCNVFKVAAWKKKK